MMNGIMIPLLLLVLHFGPSASVILISDQDDVSLIQHADLLLEDETYLELAQSPDCPEGKSWTERGDDEGQCEVEGCIMKTDEEGLFPATTCAGGWIVGDVWADSCGIRHECMDSGKIMRSRGGIVECVSGDTWKEKNGDDTLYCICHDNHKLCMDSKPTGYVVKSCGGQSTECEDGVTWTEKVGNDILYGICNFAGHKECIEFKPVRPLVCVEGDWWADYAGCFIKCVDGQFPLRQPCFETLCPGANVLVGPGEVASRVLVGPGELVSRIPPHLNDCKVRRGEEIHFAVYNEKCIACEDCDPCDVFNVRTCNCRKQPFKKC